MTSPAAKRENLFVNIIFNIAIPTFILTKFSKEESLGPVWGLVVALAFPIGYGIWDFIQRRQANFISIIGFISVLLSGGLGLLKTDLIWFAVKEAAVPGVIGLAVLGSMKTKRPLIRSLLYNDQIIDVERVDSELETRGNRSSFEQLLARSSYGLAASFLLSSTLNFVLARIILKSAPGTPEFNAELARMNLLSWPVIVVPSTVIMMVILWRLLGGINRLTGLTQEEIFRSNATPAAK